MANKQAKKTITTTAFKDMTTPELIVKAKQLAFEISKKKLEKSVGRLKNMREIFHMRKDLARVKTIISVKSADKS
jgi:ribosomal protein L29